MLANVLSRVPESPGAPPLAVTLADCSSLFSIFPPNILSRPGRRWRLGSETSGLNSGYPDWEEPWNTTS